MTADASTANGPQPVVLVHGLWLTPLSWEAWVERYSARGHRVLAPAWPGMDRPIEDVRSDAGPYERIGVAEITDHYEAIIRELEAPPIIIGHSFGGLITELLLDRGFGSAGIAISPAPIKGILGLPLPQLRVASVALKNPANRHRAVALTAKQFHYGFTNNLSLEQSQPIFERHAIPGPGRVLFQAALANMNPNAVTKIDRHKADRAPLLLVANGHDHTVPASATRAAYKIQRKSGAITALKEYPERSHWTAGEDGWEAVADHALDWATDPKSSD